MEVPEVSRRQNRAVRTRQDWIEEGARLGELSGKPLFDPLPDVTQIAATRAASRGYG